MIVNILKLKKDNSELLFRNAVQQIYGIGNSAAKTICRINKISDDVLCKDLSSKKAEEISRFVNNNLLVDISLGSFLRKKKDRHINCSTYRGIRHKLWLPVRGQRTHSNASLGKKKRVGEKEKTKLSRRDLAKKYKKKPQQFPKI